MNKILPIFLLAIVTFSCQTTLIKTNTELTLKTKWVDSIYNQMTVQEKVGQLFMVDDYSNRDQKQADSISQLITNYHLGGLVFFQGGPVRQAQLTNHYQTLSKIPLMIGIDAEWDLGMRLDSTARIPFNMTLGAVSDNNITFRIGTQLGKHCKRMGIHVNFAPVVDINTNPKNPIIGVRSFGQDKYNVTEKTLAFTAGMQGEGILACAKHFPGHGDTATDSHKTLPTVSFDAQRIDSVELYPFKEAFKNGMASVMVAHLNIPSLESTEGLPSSLSYKVTTELLKEKLKFNGLIFTDALNMKGAANYGKPGGIDLLAFKAGNDVLLFSENAPKAILLIIEAVQNNEVSEERLAYSVKKILAAKYNVGLNNYQPIKIEGLVSDLNTTADKQLYQETIEKAMTLIKNEGAIIPFDNENNKNVVSISLGDGTNEVFLKTLQAVSNISTLAKNEIQKLNKNDLVILSYHRKNARRTYSISKEEKQLIEKISKNNRVIFIDFASLYCVSNLSFENIESVIIAYENSAFAQKTAAQIILGNITTVGRLPASINTEFSVGFGIDLN